MHNFREASGLIFTVNGEFQEIERLRKKTLTALSALPERPSQASIDESSNCNKCRSYFYKTGPTCSHCRLEEVILQYKSHLLTYKRNRKLLVSNSTSNSTGLNNGNNGGYQRLGGLAEQFDEEELEVRQFAEGEVDGPFIMIIKQLRAFANRNSLSKGYADLCKLELARIELLREEFYSLLGLWDRHSELLKSYDELAQCKSTVTLADVQTKIGQGASIEDQLAAFYSQSYESAIISQCDLKEAFNSLSFYKNQILPKNDELEDDINDGGCAICQETLHGIIRPPSTTREGDRVTSEELNRLSPPISNSAANSSLSTLPSSSSSSSTSLPSSSSSGAANSTAMGYEVVILPCAHQFHRGCVYKWLTTHKRCPLCKHSALPVDLTLVAARPSTSQLPQSPSKHLVNKRASRRVRGVWGTKVDALVADLTKLVRDPSKIDDKAIVFSQWIEVTNSTDYLFN